MSDSILTKTARGAGWAVGWRMFTRALGFLNTLILARLLIPADFGLVALATGFAQGINAFSALGIDEAVMRQTAATRTTYDTAFTINLIRGLATSLVVAACAWPAGRFFNDMRLVPVLLALAGCSMVTAFENIGTIEFRRDFAFEREFKLQLMPRLAAVAVTVGCALIWHSHWALVAGIATGQIFGTAAGYVMHPYRPRLGLKEWRKLASFSAWSWGISIAVMFRDRVDSFVIGRLLGLRQVGVYSVGVEMATLPTYELAAPLGRACFAGFAAASRSGTPIAETFLRILASVSLIMLPVGAGIALVARPVVMIALGPAWMPAAGVIRIVGASGTVTVLGIVTATLLSSHGILKPAFGISILSMVIRAVSALTLVRPFGLTGAAAGCALMVVVENLAFIVVAFRRFGIRIADLPRLMWRGFLATAAMASVLLWFHLGVDITAPVRTLAEAVVLGALVYALVLSGSWLASGRPEGAETDLWLLAGRVFPTRRLANWAARLGLRRSRASAGSIAPVQGSDQLWTVAEASATVIGDSKHDGERD